MFNHIQRSLSAQLVNPSGKGTWEFGLIRVAGADERYPIINQSPLESGIRGEIGMSISPPFVFEYRSGSCVEVKPHVNCS